MPDLADGESFFMKGSGAKPYELKNTGGLYSCNCPAWRNQSLPIEQRTCKHLRKLRGDAAEDARIGRTGALPAPRKAKDDTDKEGAPVLLAQTWDNELDLTGWWLSEKLDGVRAYWDGKQFLSRQGNRYHAPDWFVEELPDVPLDGELWLGRKKFQRAVSIARRQDKSDLWRELRFVIFDAPGVQAEFETRVEFYQDYLRSKTPQFAVAHPQEVCRNLEHLRAELDRIETLGGEGLMLRQPRSKYEIGRSSTLLKVKRFLDAEAKVLEHQPGAGRHKGRMGALGVEMTDGTRFSVGTGFSDAERANPPPLGSTITFRYQELSDGGVPRFPSYVGIRADARITTPTPVESVARPAKAKGASVTVPALVSVAAKPAPTATPAVGEKPRHFEFVDSTSSKFWEVSVKGADMTTRWGRIGTAGQSKTKTFKDEAAALAAAAKLVEEKTGDGYVEK
jgi:DNA ligase 1